MPSSPAPQLPYHRLAHLRPETARWWRPFAALGTVLGLVLATGALLVVGFGIVSLAAPPAWRMSDTLEDPTNPADLLFLLGSLAVLIPAVVLGMRWGGGMRGAIHSVAGRLRWLMMLRTSAVLIPVYALVIGISWAVAPPDDLAAPPRGSRTVAAFAVILLLVPLQCAAEEYAFRGLPQQLIGTWLRSPVWGIVLPVPLFVIGHGYDAAGLFDVAVFALCAGFLVWKGGDLELAIVVHVANNLILFLLAPSSPSSLQQGTTDPAGLLLSVPLALLTTWGLTAWVSRTHGIRLLEPVRSAPRGQQGGDPAPTAVSAGDAASGARARSRP
ncbi:CPBP family intramembrane metalloprotease [Clavibacter michiganensis subsp. phaseoli]|uniref:CPBP family intramembrane glutamic endopeptidase n=1 Tax=Clavibacter phaseoli TaxID=1734031 RepID=UPI001FB25742|nr:type II CAAX endopeptidase family protein [Clavibacter phaseoli]MCJ1709622.1 CPBP family intramembrane metalloprotease [Clavibacter phaseoli]